MKKLEASKLFPYIACTAILLFGYFAYQLSQGVAESSHPLKEKMDSKVEYINSIPKGTKKN